MRHPQRDPVGPGQESVWDYPRPPSALVSARRVEVVLAGTVLGRSDRAVRVCETSHPPVYYLPREDLAAGVLERAGGASWCEWKGVATYWDAVVDGVRHAGVGWSYEDPAGAYRHLRSAVAFYPSRLDRATVDGEVVRAQAGDFYGGWITDDVVGPFKGEPGTRGW